MASQRADARQPRFSDVVTVGSGSIDDGDGDGETEGVREPVGVSDGVGSGDGVRDSVAAGEGCAPAGDPSPVAGTVSGRTMT